MAAEKFSVVVTDKAGLHARPASRLAKEASKYTSEISIECDGKTGNLKSIMNLIAMAIKTGQEVTVSANGDDAAKAVEGIKKTMEEIDLIPNPEKENEEAE